MDLFHDLINLTINFRIFCFELIYFNTVKKYIDSPQCNANLKKTCSDAQQNL